jgi:hypothetical protein
VKEKSLLNDTAYNNINRRAQKKAIISFVLENICEKGKEGVFSATLTHL